MKWAFRYLFLFNSISSALCSDQLASSCRPPLQPGVGQSWGHEV